MEENQMVAPVAVAEEEAKIRRRCCCRRRHRIQIERGAVRSTELGPARPRGKVFSAPRGERGVVPMAITRKTREKRRKKWRRVWTFDEWSDAAFLRRLRLRRNKEASQKKHRAVLLLLLLLLLPALIVCHSPLRRRRRRRRRRRSQAARGYLRRRAVRNQMTDACRAASTSTIHLTMSRIRTCRDDEVAFFPFSFILTQLQKRVRFSLILDHPRVYSLV